LIGDGRLNYRETFYAMSVTRSVTLTFDDQFLAKPAHNPD
jgi:high affinity Mn2+ porin